MDVGLTDFAGKVVWSAARPTVAGDRDVVFDVDSTLIFIMTEVVGV